jgi:small-conductance mechanosensitive channel
MTEEHNSIVDITQEDLQAMLHRSLRNTLILGVVASIAVLIGGGWRSAAMLATGMLISAASILDWAHLVRVFNVRIEKGKTPSGAWAAILFFVLKLTIYAGVIYGSLKCFQGSVTALLCGLSLAVLTVGWEAIRLLRD